MLSFVDGFARNLRPSFRRRCVINSNARPLCLYLTMRTLPDIPSSQQNESVDQIQQILNTGAVKYVHENESLLKPSKVEEEAIKELKVCHILFDVPCYDVSYCLNTEKTSRKQGRGVDSGEEDQEVNKGGKR